MYTHATALLLALILVLHAVYAPADALDAPSFRAWAHLGQHRFALLAVALVAVLVPAVRNPLGRAVRRATAWLIALRHPAVLAGGAFLGVQGALFSRAMPPPDSDVILFGLTHGVVLAGSNSGERVVHQVAWQVVQRLPVVAEPSDVMAVSSVLAGGVAIGAVVSLASRIPQPHLPLTALVLGGWTAIFFGHVEVYAWPTATALVALVLWTAREPTPAGTVAAMGLTGLALTLHGMAGILLPVAAVALWCRRPDWATLLGSGGIAVVPPLLVVAFQCAWGVPWASYAALDSVGGADGRWFVAVWETSTPFEHAPLVSLRHLTNVGGQVVRAVPGVAAGVAVVVSAAWGAGRRCRFRVPREAWAAGASGLLFSLLWNADFGGWGDWDLFSLASVMVSLPVLWAAGSVLDDEDADAITGAVLAASLAITLPRWIGPALGLEVV